MWVLVPWCVAWLVGPRCARLPRATKTQRVSIIIPARNEALRLPVLLAALVDTSLETIVVDDGSTDETAAIARDSGVAVVAAGEPPAGWTGKSWACWQGAAVASGEILVFLDADTEPAMHFIENLAAAASQHNGLVSVEPWHRIERRYEKLSAMINLVTVMGAGTGWSGGRRWWRAPMAFGPAMAIPTQCYFAIGGHESVRSEVAEDVALGQRCAERDVRVGQFLGNQEISFRMYPEGVGQLVEGWTKNLAFGANATPPLRMVIIVTWIAAALATGIDVFTSLSVLSVALYLLFMAQIAVLLRRVGSFTVLDALVYPALLIAFVVLFMRSAVMRLLRRPLQWRGRTLPGGQNS